MQASALPEVDAIDRNQLADGGGRSLKELKRALTPRWGRVWADIAAGYLALGATALALGRLERSWPGLLPLWIALGAVAFGLAIAFIQLFLHEAAHFNIAPGRKLNDRLANVFIGLMVGQDIKAYRTVHFDHHRYLGTTRDTERSYFDALDARFIAESLLGIKLLAVLTRRGERVEAAAAPALAGAAEEPAAPSGRRRRLAILAGGAALNLAIVAAAALTGHWAVAIAWPLGMGSVHPFVNATRQLLEHRGFDARPDVDYATTSHGAVTRMFGAGPLAGALGGAGFNRHLLHHWEPQISYTRFAELERFLLDTASAPVFRAATTTYPCAFRRLWRAP